MTNKRAHNKKRQKSLPESLALGIALGVLLAISLLLIGTAIAYKSLNPAGLTLPIALISLGVCSFFVGFGSAKLYGRNHPTTGLLAGLGWAVLLLASSFAFGAEGEKTLWRYLCYAGAMLLSAVGGLVACRARDKKRRRRR